MAQFARFMQQRNREVELAWAWADKIMRQHNGSIQVKSAPGEGTTFRLEF